MANSQQPQTQNPVNWWKWISIGCGGCLLTSILAIAAFVYFVVQNVSTEPQEVEQHARSIFDYQIPGGSKGVVKINLMGIEFAQVVDVKRPPEVLLMVGQTPQKLQPDQLENTAKSLETNLNRRFNFTTTSRQVLDKQLCGQNVSVLVQQGEFTSSDGANVLPAIAYTATVNYSNTGRMVWLMAQGSDAKDIAADVFDSLECK
ncbi:MAG: hypothetical protein AB4038_17345 [Prochloraceae cyanobacterium]